MNTMLPPRPHRLPLALALVAFLAVQAACAPSPSEEPAPDTTAVAGGVDLGPGADGFPTIDSTGPLVPRSEMERSESVSSEADGQVIENLEVDGRVRIVHSNVVLRNVRINHIATQPGQYALLIEENEEGVCPTGVRIEHVEVVGDPAILDDQAKAVYAPCPLTLEDSRVYGVGSAVRLTSGSVLRGNYILADFSNEGSDTHRSAIGINGGSDNVIDGNTVTCEGPGCSGALVMYGSNARIADTLVTGNLFNTTGSYCTYAGSLDSKPFPTALNVHYLDNVFGQRYFETCGRYGPVAGLNSGGGPGFVWQGNTWQESGDDVSFG
ncbi:MAG TPA: right-handed parallel beta-helix repeat-containing protein [Candidatus Ruania gallistercoris]|uniref:Right-handed parallel beta-helix repeat-containing protein n=1 Tax=Candidatus Ruania gallistercoris TaxID=2838746 RepID=A0A9D2J5Z5_9MICO|nr:right-handed parallel beta-helix repeat-containing protein [Candidatus Ruania gallistercoris]